MSIFFSHIYKWRPKAGLPEFQKEAPFDASMIVHFRKHLNGPIMQGLESIAKDKNGDEKLKSIIIEANGLDPENPEIEPGRVLYTKY